MIKEKEQRPANRRLAQWRVKWLIEHSNSHQNLRCIDSFVLRNPPLRQAPKRYGQLKKQTYLRMEIGLIEWFDESKGFGLIKTADNNEVFLHISNWKDSRNLNPEDKLPVLFTIGFQRNKTTALDCKYFDENSSLDWQTLLTVKEHNFLIKLKYSEFNILRLTFNSLNADFDYSITKGFFKELIENLSESELFDRHHWIYKTFQNLKIDSVKTLLLKVSFPKKRNV